MAEAARKYIGDNEYVVFDAGTTIRELAKRIRGDRRLTAVTYDLLTAVELAKRPQMELLMIGGFLRKTYYSTYGFFAENMLRKFRADKAFLSADAIDMEQGIMSYTPDDIQIKQLIVESAAEVILMCDHSKFDTKAFLNICDLKKVSRVITGRELSGDMWSGCAPGNRSGTGVGRQRKIKRNEIKRRERMDIRLIAVDLVGTLLNSQKELTPRTKEALTRAAEKGVHIVPPQGGPSAECRR